MKVYQEHADVWVTHLIENGGVDQQVSLGRRRSKPTRFTRSSQCGNCGRDTDYLFEGFKDPPQMAAVELYQFRGKPATKAQVRALCEPFSTERTMVCMACRPPSNLEIEEILHGN